MTMKKKLLTTMSVVLILGMAVLGILAYLTATADNANTMTNGNVNIRQIELERDANGNLQEFTQNKEFYPAVGEIAFPDSSNEWQQWETGGSSALFEDSLKNVIDKFVFVENTGRSDAYVRTWFAFEAGSFSAEQMNDELLHYNINADHWTWCGGEDAIFNDSRTAMINGVKYYVTYATYTGTDAVHKNGILPSGETTRPSLLQVFLDSSVTNEHLEAFDGTYEILAFSEAVQVEGFETPNEAMTAAEFDVAPWGTEYELPSYVAPRADVETLNDKIEVESIFTGEKYTLNSAYSFKTTEEYDEAQDSDYAKWHADFVVTFDEDVPEGTAGLAGQYETYSTDWIAFETPFDVEKGKAVRLLGTAGIAMNYEELCLYVKEFNCGIFDVNNQNKGTTATVELRLYETEEPSTSNGNSWNVETGNFIIVKTVKYTFK